MYLNNCFLLIVLYFSLYNVKSDENDDDFLDIGVRLMGDHRDNLIADLIAEERDLINAGHVSLMRGRRREMRIFWN